MGTAPGIDETNVTAWMSEWVGATAPLTFELIAGGRSNLTYRVTDFAGTTYALRRPPTSHVLATAHDMVREHTLLSALYPQGVPVPRPLGLCVDETVNEQPFFVMDFVEGAILRDEATATATFSPDVRAGIGDHLAATLAGLHEVDVDEAGLSAFARHDGYIERQLKRWRAQLAQTRVAGLDHDNVVEEVADELARTVPPQQRVSVVHGDYRLDNTVLDETGDVRAILDWEIATLGDPLADLGTLLCYWAEPGDETLALADATPTLAAGFSSRHDVLEAYARHSDLDLAHVPYYQAFGYWKLACILQGVFARYTAGAAAGDPGSVTEFPAYIATLAATARETLGK